ncbi:MAG: methionyl-tRNA formyltransferase [Anaeroplasmataceae bacterium]
MKIVFMGTPKFSVRILEALSMKYDVVLVVTQPDKPQGRKRILTPSPVKAKALELGLNVFQPTNIKEDYEPIINTKADMIVSAAYGQIVPDVVLNSFKKCINVHASLLPKYRGGAPIQRAIINGDLKTGVSIIDMVHKMDAGDIYAMKEIDILDTDNNEILFDKLSVIGEKLLIDNIDDIYNLRMLGTPQDESKVVFSPNIKRSEEKISFNDTSRNIFNKIRGLAMEPGAYGVINNENIKIYSSSIVEYNGNEEPGMVIDLNKKILVKTIDGAVSLGLIKPTGKSMMKASEYVNGQKLIKLNDCFM